MPQITTAADAYGPGGARAVIDLLRARGMAVGEPAAMPPAGPPAEARIDHGRWIAECRLDRADTGAPCPAAQWVDPADPRMYCVECDNAAVGGAWRPVTWPADQAAVEAAVAGLPTTEQNWTPEV